MKQILHNKISKFCRWSVTAVFAMCLLLLGFGISASAADSGTCGGDLQWSLSGGVLTIKGSGPMTNFPESTMAPWYGKRESITSVSISDKVTTIGDLAFYGCTGLQSVSVPSSVTTIGDISFAGCSNLVSVYLSEGLKSIGENAFARCTALTTVRMPSSLIRIGFQAFYLCEGLTSVRVPSNVSKMESGVFAYCSGLMQAVVDCSVTELPPWTFYGCTSLTNVSLNSYIAKIGEYAFKGCSNLNKTYYEGSDDAKDEITDQIGNDVSGFDGVTDGNGSGSTTLETTKKEPSGEQTDTEHKVTDSENMTMDTTIDKTTSGGKTEYDITIDATIDNEDGWNEILDQIGGYLEYPDRYKDSTVNKINMILTNNTSTKVPKKVLQTLAGKKANLTLKVGTKGQVTVDLESLNKDEVKKDYDLNFTLTKNDNPTKSQKKLIGNAESYVIEFNKSIPFNVTVTVNLGTEYAGQYATICQKAILKKWEKVQSVHIDDQGCASFYISEIDTKVSYLIAINLETVYGDETLISDSMSDDYEGLTDANGTKYVISGTKSAWGMSFFQVTMILVGIMAVSVIIVGVVVGTHYKLKAKKNILEKIQTDQNRKVNDKKNT